MHARDLLPDPPSGFRQFEPPVPAARGLTRLYAKLLFGYADGLSVIWTAHSPTDRVQAIRLFAWLYESPALAAQTARSFPARAIDSLASVVRQDGALVWTSGDVKFTSLDHFVYQSIFGCEAVSDPDFDALPMVLDLNREIESRIQAETKGQRISPRSRQLGIGLVAGLLIGVLGFIVASQFGIPPEVVLAIGLAAVVYWASIRPRIFKARRLRRFLSQGDQTGDLRRALGSLGIRLPPND